MTKKLQFKIGDVIRYEKGDKWLILKVKDIRNAKAFEQLLFLCDYTLLCKVLDTNYKSYYKIYDEIILFCREEDNIRKLTKEEARIYLL